MTKSMTRNVTPELPLCALPGCGNLVKPPSRADRTPAKFCSPECHREAIRRRSEIEPPYCERPGCRNRVKPPRGRRPPNKYCCRACANEGRSERMAGTREAMVGLKGAAARWSAYAAKREETNVIERPSESRQAPPPRPITAIYNPAVVIHPARPAPRRHGPDGTLLMFCDDLLAIADRGSPGILMRPGSDLGRSGSTASLAVALGE